MSYPLTHSLSHRTIFASAGGAIVIAALVIGAGASFNYALAATEDGSLEAPPAASGRPLFEDLEATIRPQSYPGLPAANPLQQDPEQIREALRRDVEQALTDAPELADTPILVHVTSLRRARLSGIVANASTRILAEIIVAGVDGISGVDNGLSIESEQDLRPWTP